MDEAQPEPACTIVTIDGVEVAHTEALASGRPHRQQPRLWRSSLMRARRLRR